ncbi:MAG: hypothetical protein KKE20_04890 [Nanoarchaeota archaeon]|nr:hypothetical protein [Nanoarchaeota archaeon]
MKYKKIRFPKDVFPHDKVIEWWYFNGNLADSSGRRYSFMHCLFRADAKKSKIPFIERIPLNYVLFSHGLLSDISQKKTYQDVYPIVFRSVDSYSKPRFFVNFAPPSMKGYLNYEIEETGPHCFRVKSKFLDIMLRSKKEPLLEGGKGFLDLDSKQTFYYSLTNMHADGWIIIDKKRIHVTGKAWMDHQWADEYYTRDKWSWFSIQFDNDTELVCFEYDVGKKKSYLASIIDKKSRSKHTSNVKLIPDKRNWKSPVTGAVYPLDWKIIIPEFDVDIRISSPLKEQEVLFSTINYWEGPISAAGKVFGKSAKGKGFMELASYPMDKSLTQRLRKHVENSLKEELVQTKEKILDIHKAIFSRKK